VAAYSLGVDRRTGRRRIVRRYMPTEREADAELARIRRRYEGVGPVAAMTVDEYLAEWLDAVRLTVARRTHESYAGLATQHVSPLLGGIRVGELRPSDVGRLSRDRIGAGLSPSTVRAIVGVLRAALGQAVRDGELPSNVARIRLPRVERERVEAMTPETADAILDLARFRVDEDGREHGALLEPLVTLLLGCGLRIGEACALDWRDLALPRPGQPAAGRESVTVRLGKTAASRRTVPLPAFVTAALVAHRARSARVGQTEPVFIGERGGRLRRETASHAFHRLQERAGLEPIRLHDLRHGTATLLVARGVPMRVVAEVLGHADPSVTANVYAHVSLDSKAAAMAEMDLSRQRSTRR
jgi:integrase